MSKSGFRKISGRVNCGLTRCELVIRQCLPWRQRRYLYCYQNCARNMDITSVLCSADKWMTVSGTWSATRSVRPLFSCGTSTPITSPAIITTITTTTAANNNNIDTGPYNNGQKTTYKGLLVSDKKTKNAYLIGMSGSSSSNVKNVEML
jgi:hypothetical protein